MSEINFIPWIGDNYLSKGYKGKRILVLGESHYCNGEESILQINERDKTKVWTYLVNGKLIPAIKVHHPSSRTGKKWNYWHEFYKIFFELSNIVD